MKSLFFILAFFLIPATFGSDARNLFPGSVRVTDIGSSVYSMSATGHVTHLKNGDMFVVDRETTVKMNYADSAVFHLSNGVDIFLQDHTDLTFPKKTFMHVANSSDYFLRIEFVGTAWFRSSRTPTERDSFFIMTNAAEIEVESSEFYVESFGESYTLVRCLQGKLRFSSSETSVSVEVLAGEEARIRGCGEVGCKNAAVTKYKIPQRFLHTILESRKQAGLSTCPKWVLQNNCYVTERTALPSEQN